ncbi:SAM-dependent methyltransferase [Bacillus sp. CGMCC 1.16541]|uniref:class I SAM-dependent methyltransferase n=1 Tax=Bacillus sp. CGMCC 1.16541 TaxID=2185143 RepID=UPI000D7279A3|nr:SAM-dependent methyltransferase [Bacillus sp. CGMCC 1.16541]
MKQVLKKQIKESLHKRISYSEYMNIALYGENGYYMKNNRKIGKHGDFVTTSELSSSFGRAMAHLFVKAVEHRLIPPVICEIGGGNGKFAEAVINEWRKISPKTANQLTYYMIEKSLYHQQLQRHHLSSSNDVLCFESLEAFALQVGKFDGVVFSNEWLDALPVEVIEKRDGVLYEVWVALENDELVETYIPIDNQQIIDYLSQHRLSIKEGQRFEVPLQMLKAIKDISEMLNSGMVVTVDYGYTFEEWQHPARSRGSLRGYFQHQLIKNPLLHVGEMDLTTHIHFDSLIAEGQQYGLHVTTFKRQREFLMMMGLLNLLEEHSSTNPFSSQAKSNRSISSLMIEGSISDYFHVIVQHKHIEMSESFLVDVIKKR